jgi:hypothetical protein
MSELLAAVIGVPIVMAIGLFLILRTGRQEPDGEGADVPEEQ